MNLESIRFGTVEMTVLRVVKLLYPVCNAELRYRYSGFIITSSVYFLTVTGINVSTTPLYLIDKRNTGAKENEGKIVNRTSNTLQELLIQK